MEEDRGLTIYIIVSGDMTLTDAGIRALLAPAKRKQFADGHGLSLDAMPSGKKSAPARPFIMPSTWGGHWTRYEIRFSDGRFSADIPAV
jgi:hypothetical protein